MTVSRKLALSALVLGVVGLVAGLGAFSAFSSVTTSAANSFTAGTVALADNDAGSAMLALTNAKPNDASESCIAITYTGTLDSAVRIYGSVSGSLNQYLTVTVTRGTQSPVTFGSACTNFTADATNYIGQGAGVIFSGNLSTFTASSWANGLADPAVGGGNETWTTNEVHVYKFAVTLQNTTAAQGLSGSASFTWEAQNL
jgi:predicted ribosomally synthesized peptide with SipW-like signal peptide